MRIGSKIQSYIASDTPFFMVMPAVIWQVLFFYIPFLVVIFFSITYKTVDDWSFAFTTHHYQKLFDPIYVTIIMRSLILASFTAVVCTCVAYPLAYFLAFRVKRFRNQLLTFLVLPFWVNFLVQVYAWFFVLEKHGLINMLLLKLGVITSPIAMLNTPFAVYLVMIYCYIPFAVMPIYSILEKFDKRLWEASADLGAKPWQTFVWITLPMTALGIRTGFFMVLVPAFGEFVIPTLLGGGKQLYVGSLLTHYFLLSRNFNTGAAFTVINGIILLLVALLFYAIFTRLLGIRRTPQ